MNPLATTSDVVTICKAMDMNTSPILEETSGSDASCEHNAYAPFLSNDEWIEELKDTKQILLLCNKEFRI